MDLNTQQFDETPTQLINVILAQYEGLLLSQLNFCDAGISSDAKGASKLQLPAQSLIDLEDYSIFIEENKKLIDELCKSEIYRNILRNGFVTLFCSCLYNNNQFIELSRKSLQEIQTFYSNYIDTLSNHKVHEHYKALLDLFNDIKTQNVQFAHQSDDVICSEYSADFQIKILSLDIHALKEPILDIGCGKNMTLVKFLKHMGYDATGVDRDVINLKEDKPFDWFTFNYQKNYWGTIISQMAFSNHFIFNHLYKYGNPEKYAKLYMTILSALKSEGDFYYAPGLPFIEKFLPRDKYNITKHPIHIPNCKKQYMYSVRLKKQ